MRVLVILLGLMWVVPAMAAAQTYDLLFREGVLSDIHLGEALTYFKATDRSSSPKDGSGDKVSLAITPEKTATLTLEHGGKHRQLGSFPASVGNPVIMYFLETTVRDMAAQAGGSPFYIRNRIKEALLGEAEIVPVKLSYNDREVDGQRVTLHPFSADKARDKMGGFADLALAVTVSDEIPGWYYSLVASAPLKAGSDQPGYSSSITLISGQKGRQ
ncbi:hypothetical protein [Notoacmeibacter sp. MSK16QG-6]|uniref:hypothetical protein n=1 Tax=Notoacmeibacter sp. MSK16QG-6 TaxID=2957982 RepID=UPI00209CB70E|nr:hypothetical protein [Notoacmeibacter sp. MSK16QG-6]MCP1200639.1 hypothetical protein [Notoacmeibacter sp. MSK16QG-6]